MSQSSERLNADLRAWTSRYLGTADEDDRQSEQEGGRHDHVHRALRAPSLQTQHNQRVSPSLRTHTHASMSRGAADTFGFAAATLR